MKNIISLPVSLPVDSGTADTPSATVVVDVNAIFETDAEVGTLVHNTTDGTFALVTAVTNDSMMTLATGIMAAGEEFTLHSADAVDSGTCSSTTTNKLVQSGQNFVTTISVGDVVTNTTTGAAALVTAIDGNTTLSLDADIMTSGDTFIIYDGTVLYEGTQSAILQDAGQNFLTTCSVGDVIKNTTDTTYATVTAVLTDTVLALSGNIMANAEAYTVYSATSTSRKDIGTDGLILVESVSANVTTLNYGGGSATDVLTVEHGACSGVTMRTAFEKAILAAAKVNGPQLVMVVHPAPIILVNIA